MAENGETWLDASIICVYGPSGTLTIHLKATLQKSPVFARLEIVLIQSSFDSTIKSLGYGLIRVVEDLWTAKNRWWWHHCPVSL